MSFLGGRKSGDEDRIECERERALAGLQSLCLCVCASSSRSTSRSASLKDRGGLKNKEKKAES